MAHPSLEEQPAEAVIYAAKPWTAASDAVVAAFDVPPHGLAYLPGPASLTTTQQQRLRPSLIKNKLSAFETLTTTLSGSDASTWNHSDLEEYLDAAGRELLRLLLQDHLDLRAAREEGQVRSGAGPVAVGPEGRVRPWRETGHSRWLATTFGMVRVARVAHRGRGVGNVHPADAVLSLPAGRYSTGLRRLAVTEAVRG